MWRLSDRLEAGSGLADAFLAGARHGPERANRAGVPDFRSHLAGRIAWVELLHPARGARLRHRFAEVDWAPPSTDSAG